MSQNDPIDVVNSMREEVIYSLVDSYIPPESLEDQWNIAGLSQTLLEDFQLKADIAGWIEEDHHIQPDDIRKRILALCCEHYQQKENHAGREVMAQFEKSVILQTIDNHWREHLAAMDYLRQGIHLRGYAQKDPKQEYKREAFSLFTMMLDGLKYDVIRLLTSVQVQNEDDVNAVEEQRRAEQISNMHFLHDNDSVELDEEESTPGTFRRTEQKIGRNDACPCGSGKKYKSCHGKLA